MDWRRTAKRLGQRRKAAPSLAISSVQLQPARAEPSVPGPVDHNASGGVGHRKGKNLHTVIIREYSVETNERSTVVCALPSGACSFLLEELRTQGFSKPVTSRSKDRVDQIAISADGCTLAAASR